MRLSLPQNHKSDRPRLRVPQMLLRPLAPLHRALHPLAPLHRALHPLAPLHRALPLGALVWVLALARAASESLGPSADPPTLGGWAPRRPHRRTWHRGSPERQRPCTPTRDPLESRMSPQSSRPAQSCQHSTRCESPPERIPSSVSHPARRQPKNAPWISRGRRYRGPHHAE